MKFGVNTFLWTASFSAADLPLFPRLREAGFDSVEVSLFRPSEFPAAAIRRAAEENGLEVTVCSVLTNGLNLLSDDADVRARTLGFLRDAAQAVSEAGARIIAGPLYSPVGFLPGRRRTADEWRRAVDAYQSLGPTLDATGVTVAIEPLNRFETYFLNTAADVLQFCREVDHPRVGILFDTFHANIEEKDVAAAFRLVGPCLKHVHSSENDRGIPGTGHVDWPAFFAALRSIPYDDCVTIESFGFALGEIAAAASVWRDLAPTPESIAFEGVRFLRGFA